MTRREIARAIFVSGSKLDYTVHHNISGEHIVCYVAQIDVANAIVRALRDRIEAKGKRFARSSVSGR